MHVNRGFHPYVPHQLYFLGDNGGVGGYIDAGCVRYQFDGGAKKICQKRFFLERVAAESNTLLFQTQVYHHARSQQKTGQDRPLCYIQAIRWETTSRSCNSDAGIICGDDELLLTLGQPRHFGREDAYSGMSPGILLTFCPGNM